VHEIDERDVRAIDTHATAFFNVNTAEDLAEARRIAAERPA